MMLEEVDTDVRIVNTRQFGELHVEPHHVFVFPEGLIGFDELHEFVLIADEQSAPLNWLISLEQPEIGFPVLNPHYVDLTYSAGKEYADEDAFATYVVVTLSKEGMTVNMKAPVILDTTDLTGKQIILASDRHLPNHPLGKQSNA